MPPEKTKYLKGIVMTQRDRDEVKRLEEEIALTSGNRFEGWNLNAVKSETVSPAKEFWESLPVLTRTEMTDFEFAEAYASHVSSLSSQAIGAAAKEAAEKISGRFDLNDGAVEPVEPEIAAIISAELEKARTK